MAAVSGKLLPRKIAHTPEAYRYLHWFCVGLLPSMHANTCKYMQYIHIRKYIHNTHHVRIYVFVCVFDRIHHPLLEYAPICTTRFTDGFERVSIGGGRAGTEHTCDAGPVVGGIRPH